MSYDRETQLVCDGLHSLIQLSTGDSMPLQPPLFPALDISPVSRRHGTSKTIRRFSISNRYGHGLLTFPCSTVANLLSDHTGEPFGCLQYFFFSFKSVWRYVLSGDLRSGVVTVLADGKKMMVGRRKR